MAAARSESYERDLEKNVSPDQPASPDVEEPVEEHEDYASSSSHSAHNERHADLAKRQATRSFDSDHRLSRQSSILSTVRSRGPGQDNPFSHKLAHVPTGPDVLVHFEGDDDPYKPINWPFKKKAIATMLYGLTTCGATGASSIYSSAVGQIMSEFHVGQEVATLGVSLLLMGFGVGPLIWAPLSEVYGRKPAVLIPYAIAIAFTFGTAAAKDIQTIMITRFFSGFFASAPVTNTGGVLGDLWSAEQRGTALVFYAFAVVGGPLIGPIIGSAICSATTWRWTEYLTAIYMIIILVLDYILIDESYGPTLLVYKARRLRIKTQNWALHAPHEEWDVSVGELAHKYMVRPFQMLATPICFLMALYASFAYGLLYSLLGAFPYEFGVVRGWGQVVSSLPFLAVLLGTLCGGMMNVFNNKFYIRKFKENGNRAVPEARLPPMMLSSVLFAVGLFIFAWTSSPKIHWFPSLIGGFLVGFAFFGIFQAALNYLVDTFQRYGASAVAANTFLRSCFGAAFPLFIDPELRGIGVGWGVSVFGFVAVLMIPIPYFFYVYGKRIRARGVWSKESV